MKFGKEALAASTSAFIAGILAKEVSNVVVFGLQEAITEVSKQKRPLLKSLGRGFLKGLIKHGLIRYDSISKFLSRPD